jgi:hypothetical protein
VSYSHTTKLVQVTVRLQDCFGSQSRSQDCAGLQLGCRIALDYGHAAGLLWVMVTSGHSQATRLFQVTARLGTSVELHSGCKTAPGYTQAARSVWGMVMPPDCLRLWSGCIMVRLQECFG